MKLTDEDILFILLLMEDNKLLDACKYYSNIAGVLVSQSRPYVEELVKEHT